MELLSHDNGIIVYLIVVGILCVGLLVAFILALLLKWDSLTTGVMREEYRTKSGEKTIFAKKKKKNTT